MPIYAYKCASCGHAKDVLQKMSDAPLTDCPACGATTFSKQLTAAGCAAMVVCQACTTPAASMVGPLAFAFTQGVAFARSGHDRAPDGPVHPIWSPPD